MTDETNKLPPKPPEAKPPEAAFDKGRRDRKEGNKYDPSSKDNEVRAQYRKGWISED